MMYARLLQTDVDVQRLQEKVRGLLERIPEPYRPWVLWGGCGLLALLVLRAIWGIISRAIRRRRPATLHPRLQKYNVDYEELSRKREQQAAAIVATSTGNRLAGYRIAQQVEAVFVEGFRTPEEAVIALKAAAAERGANAILNVKTERLGSGRCTASGDAVIATVILRPPTRSPEPFISPSPPNVPPLPPSDSQPPQLPGQQT